MRTLILALVLASGTVALSGCQAFQNPDGTLNKEKTKAAGEAAAATATTFGTFFGPIGAAVGTGIAGLILAYTTKKLGVAEGKEVGYNEGSADAGKPLPSAGVPNGKP